MKKIMRIGKNSYKKALLLCFWMLAGVVSFAQNSGVVQPSKHMVWDYDGILPYIAYVLFGIMLVAMGYVGVKSWLDNRPHHMNPGH